MKDGDFIHLDYTGRIKESGAIFDTTREDVAKAANSFNPSVKYKPIPIIIGGNFIFKSLEDEIRKLENGKIKTIELAADRAFGQRRADLVRLIPASEFSRQNLDPEVGKFITINGINGKIMSIAGGRVSVDFNHPLAGKDLVYELEVKDVIDSPEGRVRAIVSYFTSGDEAEIEASVKEKALRIVTGKEKHLHPDTKHQIADTVRKWVEKYEKIEFVDVY